jgi:hypothetical protein
MKKIIPLLIALALMPGAAQRLSAQPADREVLTTVSQVRKLSPAEAGKGHPVKLRGVVTFYDDGLFSRFLQDDTAGIYLQVTNTLVLQSGQLVEIEGVTEPGEFAPVVRPTMVTPVGEGQLPAAIKATVRELLSGTLDSQMVEISGLVRAAQFEKPTGNYYLDVVTDGERYTVIAKAVPLAKISDLWGATVRVRGVCSTLFNRQRQLFGFQLLVPDAAGLVVEKPAPADPFNVPVQPMDSLLQFTPDSVPGQHVKVTGTVVHYEPGNAIFIQNGKNGLRCQTILRDPVKPGDVVEVVGSPAKGEYAPTLEDAIYRKTGADAVPQPDSVDLNKVLTGVHDCRLVRISARVLDRVDRGVNQFLLLSAGGFVFQAYLPAGSNTDRLATLVNGSEVLVTGICFIERGNKWQAGKDWRAQSFRLLLRSPEEIQIVKPVTQAAPENWLLIVGAIELVILVVIIRLAMYVRKNRTAAK